VDSDTCGTETAPCRSLGRAIANANAGDTIDVGPGRYGDLNGDGDFGDPGDEAAEIDLGCDCMVRVDKPLMIASRNGAGATLLDAGDAPIDVVRVEASPTVFGKPKRGFTLRGSANGSGFSSEQDGITLAGNIAVENGWTGFKASGLDVVAVENRAIGNGGQGFQLSGNRDLIRGNVAIANGSDGIETDDDSTMVGNFCALNGGAGLDTERNNTLRGNVAIGNGGAGLRVSEGNVVTGNITQGNGRGMTISGDRNLLTKNAIVGNRGAGILLESGADNLVTRNSIFGNNAALDPPLATANCGFATQDSRPTDLRRNFWGAATGPGNDPADAFCALAAQLGPSPLVPFAPKEIKVKARAAQ
jgi:parallel beta-helix repeat protein